jgi:hypothetical protein
MTAQARRRAAGGSKALRERQHAQVDFHDVMMIWPAARA